MSTLKTGIHDAGLMLMLRVSGSKLTNFAVFTDTKSGKGFVLWSLFYTPGSPSLPLSSNRCRLNYDASVDAY